MRSPAESSMSSSRRDGLSHTCLARASRSSVVSPIAETTTTTSLPAPLAAATRSATFCIFSHVRHRRAAVLLDDDGQGSPCLKSILAFAGTVPAIVAEGTSRRSGVSSQEVATAADAPDPDKAAPSFRESLQEYLDRRLLIIFVFGMASGFPWVLWGSAMTAWLKESGLTRSAIGVFGTVAAAYSTHFLWAPFVDRLPFPVLSRISASGEDGSSACRSRSPSPPPPSPSPTPRTASNGRASSPWSSPSARRPRTSRSPPIASRSSPARRRRRSPTPPRRRRRGGGRATRCSGPCPFFLADMPGLDLEPDLPAAGRHVDPAHDRGHPGPRGQAAPRAVQGGGREIREDPGQDGRPRASGRASRPGWRSRWWSRSGVLRPHGRQARA